MRPTVGIVGCGRMGTALARILSGKGYFIAGLASLHLASARRLADLCGVSLATDQPRDITRKADVVFLTTPDGVIESVCDSISSSIGFNPNGVVLHCSGAHASTILSSAAKSGASIGSMHPLQSFASMDITDNPFKGIRIAIEGDPKAVSIADEMARDLEANPLQILTAFKPLYHASAVVASNFLVTLMGAAFKLIQKAGVSNEEAYSVLSPLINGTLSNIDRAGIYKSLTGPVVRGDLQTVETHVQAIKNAFPELLPLYDCLTRFTAELALEGDRIAPELIASFQQICNSKK